MSAEGPVAERDEIELAYEKAARGYNYTGEELRKIVKNHSGTFDEFKARLTHGLVQNALEVARKKGAVGYGYGSIREGVLDNPFRTHEMEAATAMHFMRQAAIDSGHKRSDVAGVAMVCAKCCKAHYMLLNEEETLDMMGKVSSKTTAYETKRLWEKEGLEYEGKS